MIVCTADRPPELRDTGAGQTVDQVKLYGDAVRWFHEANLPDDRPGVGAEWRALASRAMAEALGPPAGPVHLDLPFREPLVPSGDDLVDAPGRSDDRPWTAHAPGVRPPVEMLDVSRTAADWPRARRRRLGCRRPPATVLRFSRPPVGPCWPTRSRTCACPAP
jgi:2-succinyl-5-enolpyruvyl-6-hydroxy-3-cyclohexene-1-carboxylate synthase